MRIAFVSANRETMPDAVVPLGILYVMAALPARHATELWDLCFEDAPLAYLEARLRDFRPDVVAIGLRNIQNNDYSGYGDNLAFYEQVLATVRGCSAAPVVVGGGGFSVMPEGLMRRLRPDFGIAGEGERAFAELVVRLEGGGDDFAGIGGLHYFAGGGLVSIPPPGALQPLDGIAVPDRVLVDGRYYERFGIDSVQTKRGCPLRCDYCTYPLIEGRSIRQRDPVRVAVEDAQVEQQQDQDEPGEAGIEPPVLLEGEELDVAQHRAPNPTGVSISVRRGRPSWSSVWPRKRSSVRGKSRRQWAPRLSSRKRADFAMAQATSTRFRSSADARSTGRVVPGARRPSRKASTPRWPPWR